MEKVIPTEVKAQFLRLYQMALSDDNFSPLESKMLYHWAEEKGIPKKEMDEILLGTTGDLDIPDSLEKKIECLYDFAQMAWADGIITEDEKRTMKKFALKFNFLEENVDELVEYLLQAYKNGKSRIQIISELKD